MTDSASVRRMSQYYSRAEQPLLPNRLIPELLCWLLAILLFLLPLSAQSLDLSAAITDTPLGSHLEEWPESSEIDITSIHSADATWTAVTAEVPNPGISSPPHWYRLHLSIPNERPDYIVDINYPRLEKLNYLLFCKDTLIDQHTAGNPVRKAPEMQPELSFQFRIPTVAEGNCTLYFRLENSALL
ncbi:MAG: 7TM-DISM domain-containing protein, partial [Thalassolituus sp.]